MEQTQIKKIIKKLACSFLIFVNDENFDKLNSFFSLINTKYASDFGFIFLNFSLTGVSAKYSQVGGVNTLDYENNHELLKVNPFSIFKSEINFNAEKENQIRRCHKIYDADTNKLISTENLNDNITITFDNKTFKEFCTIFNNLEKKKSRLQCFATGLIYSKTCTGEFKSLLKFSCFNSNSASSKSLDVKVFQVNESFYLNKIDYIFRIRNIPATDLNQKVFLHMNLQNIMEEKQWFLMKFTIDMNNRQYLFFQYRENIAKILINQEVETKNLNNFLDKFFLMRIYHFLIYNKMLEKIKNLENCFIDFNFCLNTLILELNVYENDKQTIKSSVRTTFYAGIVNPDLELSDILNDLP